MAKLSKSAQVAAKFMEATRMHGLSASVSGTTVKVHACFNAGDLNAYVKTEQVACQSLDLLPAKGSSRWGSTSDGVGGAMAISSGIFVLSQGGVNSHVAKAVKALAGR